MKYLILLLVLSSCSSYNKEEVHKYASAFCECRYHSKVDNIKYFGSSGALFNCVGDSLKLPWSFDYGDEFKCDGL